MKKLNIIFKLLTIGFAIIALCKESNAQSTTVSNFWGLNRFLGWNASNGTNPLLFKTNNITRMRLNGANLPQISQGYLGISPRPLPFLAPLTWFDNNSPLSMVHLYGTNNVQNFGVGGVWRSWMQSGIFINENSDAMYVGMKPNTNSAIFNQSDAVIAWGDDPAALGGDVLRYIFSGVLGSNDGYRSSAQGMDMVRMGSLGTTGFGNYEHFGSGRQAVRRVEILDADPSSLTGANQNAPQLRTTYTYNTNPALGVFTEFQTTNLGDMYFNTRLNSTRRNFGFHTSTPQNTVEINSLLNGSSGLRFTNLTIANTPQINPGSGVLAVDANGDVIYVRGGGGAPIADNGVSIAIPGNIIQLGEECNVNNIQDIVANSFTTDRIIPNRNYNLWIASLNTESGGVGIGGRPIASNFCDVKNTLELSANLKGKYGNTNASGLRFTKLTALSPTIPNGLNSINNTKILTVDVDGDVVLTDACCKNNVVLAQNGTSIVSGNTVELGQNPLIHNTDIPMDQYNLNFSDANSANSSTGQGRVTIGLPVNYSAKLFINNRFEQQGLVLQNTTTGGCYGISNSVTGTGSNPNLGIYTLASGSSVSNTGISGFGSGVGAVNYGGYFIAQNGTQNIGIYANASQTSGNLAAHLQGDVEINGNLLINPGNLTVSGNLSKATGTFKIDHPLDPANKYLYHSFVESPDMMNIYNGNTTTDATGFTTVELPNYFEALNMEFRYQLTVIGLFAQAIIAKKINGNSFTIQTDKPNVEVSWQVTGVRKDPYANSHRIVPEMEKEPTNKGKYLYPEVYAMPESLGINYERISKHKENLEAMKQQEAIGKVKDVEQQPKKL
jgi:hypothetical protein